MSKMTRAEAAAFDRQKLMNQKAATVRQEARATGDRQRQHSVESDRSNAALLKNIPPAPRFAIKRVGQRTASLTTQTTVGDRSKAPSWRREK